MHLSRDNSLPVTPFVLETDNSCIDVYKRQDYHFDEHFMMFAEEGHHGLTTSVLNYSRIVEFNGLRARLNLFQGQSGGALNELNRQCSWAAREQLTIPPNWQL